MLVRFYQFVIRLVLFRRTLLSGENRAVHDFVYWLSFSTGRRLWDVDIPEQVVVQTTDDMCAYINSNII